MNAKLKECLVCLGITLGVVASIVIILVLGAFLVEYSETIAGLLGLVAVVFFVVYTSRNL